jgi:23S rRNA (guanosine2251-2'-O)-methyltransferase
MKKNGPEISRAGSRRDLYGLNPVLEALRAGRRAIDEITIADGVRHQRLDELIELARARKVPIRRAPRVKLDRETGEGKHQGVIAKVAAARYADAGELLDSIADRVGRDSPPLVMVLDGVEDPRNFGAILRTAECAGVDGVFISERRAVGLNETVAKAAAGAVEYVPVSRASSVVRLIEQLKERNVWVVGTVADAPAAYTDWDWTLPAALVLGGEGSGLHRLVRERCDTLVSIPLYGQVGSLNVSVAAGIVLFEARRQRAASSNIKEGFNVLSKVRNTKR